MRWVLIVSSILLFVACEPKVQFNPDPNGPENGAFTDHIEPTPYQPPIVRFTDTPSNIVEGESAGATFEIIAGENPISQVICIVDGVQVNCNPNGDTIFIETPGLGEHTIVVIVEDNNGIRDESETSFEVFDQYVRQVQNVAVNSQNKAMSDILFVIDNSGSMAEEQTNMADRIISFMEKLDGLDWRIAISTTDPTASKDYGDGKIVPFMNGSYYLSSGLGLDEARRQFADAVQREETGSGYERGIHSVYRSIERSKSGAGGVDGQLSSFFRSQAALSVVLVSDEDETVKDESDGSDLPNPEKSNGNNLISLVRSTWGQEKLFQFNSIITRPGDTQCLQPVGNGYAYGKDYEELSKLTNGIVGDICAPDYGSQLTNIGQGVANLQTVYNLTCAPQDIDRDGKPNFDVLPLDGQTVPSHQVQGGKVVFSSPLAPGNYQFVYFCFKGVSP